MQIGRRVAECCAKLCGVLLCATILLPGAGRGLGSPAVAAEPDPAAPEWVAPLAPPLALTGTFGEYRSGHFHAGLDFSTGGETGAPVRAVAAGSVVRVRAGAGGYGRALYLQTDRGPLAVYGHLARFAPDLEAFLTDAQRAAGEYEADLYPPAGRFHFAAGETLAWSGATGSGPPHLHFELRAGDRPRNPFDLGLRVPDHLPPEIEGLRLHALAPDAWVAQGLEGTLPPGEGAATIAVWGRVGVECRIVDRSGTTDARLAPQGMRLWLDETLLFERRFAESDYARGAEVERVYGTWRRAAGPWAFRLYRWPPGAAPEIAADGTLDGFIEGAELEPGPHRLRLETWDAAGQQAEACWWLVAQPPLAVRQWRAAPAPAGGWMLGVQLAGGAPEAEPTAGILWDGGAGRRAIEPLPLGEGWICAHLPGPGSLELFGPDDRPLLPPIAIGAPAALGTGRVEAAVSVTEGCLALEIHPPQPWPGLPEAALVGRDGGRQSLTRRGRGPRGGWLFAAPLDAGLGSWASLAWRIPAVARAGRLALPGLVAFSGEPGAARPVAISAAAGRLILEPAIDTFFGPTIVSATLHGPGDSLWTAWVDSSGVVHQPGGARSAEAALPLLSPLVRLGPAWWPLAGELRLWLAVQSCHPETRAGRRWGLYRRGDGGRWRWVGQQRGAGLGATIDALGDYALLDDRWPPRVTSVLPPEGATLPAAPARLEAAIAEWGSGFDPRAADIWLDGEMLIAAWDIDEGFLAAPVPAPLAPGPHRWEVRVTDRVGQTGGGEYRFTVAAPAVRVAGGAR
jgi:hypothetical protein